MKFHWLHGLIALVVVPILLGFFGRFHWVLDIFSHFRVYYLLMLLLLAVIALGLKKYRELAGLFIGIILLSLPVVKFYVPTEIEEHKKGIRIASINLQSSNEEYAAVLKYIDSGNFDVVVFQEFTPQWQDRFLEIEEDFEYQELYPAEGVFGFGIYSKIEIQGSKIAYISNQTILTVMMDLNYENQEVGLMAVHPPPPINEGMFSARNDVFESIKSHAMYYPNQLLVIGDLNSSGFSPNFKLLTKSGRLKDSRKGFGLLPTWHAQWPLIRITLDHALVTEGLEVLDRGTGPDIGSDHLPIFIEISYK